ncbi:MAG: inositol monophosphatase [Oligoflexia bacterium]|nr:inositol monophosphatase [Oligoflexia bacterium]
MDPKLRNRILRVAKLAAVEGGKVTLRYFRKLKNVNIKIGAGLVSEADHDSEKRISHVIHKRFPDHRILGEEGGFKGHPDARALWVVDPLDGTTNYVHGFPFYCVSIGFEYDGRVEVGVVHAPLLKFTFWASRGNGAYFNGRKIKTSNTEKVEDSLLATGFSYKKNEILDQELGDFKLMAERARGIRRLGSAALDLCMVAWGRFDGFWERELAPWDTAAGSLIIEEAGGRITNFKGEPFHYSMNSVLAGNPVIHEELLQMLKRRTPPKN